MSNKFKTYCIWKNNLFVLNSEWTLLVGRGAIKARTDKEAQSKTERKMASGVHEGWVFIAALEGEDPNKQQELDK